MQGQREDYGILGITGDKVFVKAQRRRGTNAGTWVTKNDSASRWTLYRIKAEQLSVGVMWVAVGLTQAHSILRRCVSCGVAIFHGTKALRSCCGSRKAEKLENNKGKRRK